MERFPLFISIGSFLLWILNVLFWPGPIKIATRSTALGLSLIQLGAAIWAAVRTFTESTGVQWNGIWFRLNEIDVFSIHFSVDAISAVLWLAVSVFIAVLAYFGLRTQIAGTRSPSRIETVSIPLIGLGSVLTIISGNFTTYYFGWSLIAVAGFLAIGFSQNARDERARASVRYAILSVIPEMIFVAGVLGCYAGAATLSFNEMNQKAATSIPPWAVVCLVLGTMLRSMQIPFMQNARYVAFARSAALPVFFVGHLILAPVLFAKIYPIISSVNGVEYLAVVPAITAFVAAILTLSENDPVMITGWLVSYVSASVFLSGLVGDYQAAQALAYTGAIATFFFANAFVELPIGHSGARWFSVIAILFLTGVPLSGFGWARYLEYIGFMQAQPNSPALQWALMGLKVMADLIMGLALWSSARERWLTSENGSKIEYDVVIPLGLIALAAFAGLTGGRPLGGITGSLLFDNFPSIAWFEHLVTMPIGTTHPNSAAISLIGSDIDIVARVLVLGVFILPALLGGLWFFRDLEKISEFRAFVARGLDKIGRVIGLNSYLWDWFISPVMKFLGRAATFFDSRIIDFGFSDVWAKPVRWIRRGFIFIEDAVIDLKLVDGLGEAVATIGKSLRIVQNGQVQFHLAIGLILMGAIVIKFIVVGG